MSDTYEASKLCVEDAIEAFHNGDFPSAAAAAKAYDLQPRCLQRRLKGVASRSTRQLTSTAVGPAQEQTVYEYIEDLDKIDMPSTIGMLKGAREYLLSEDGSTHTINRV